ncbi:MAG: cyclic nucleotide-binding domain-containing protein [Balneolaceae bacterium]|nr:cyclic nucleotide-binding domain-containing protein [Balneolaceae bacterium]
MSFEYGYKWLHDRASIIRMIEELVDERRDHSLQIVELEGDQTIFREGDYLENLYLLLEGEVELIKQDVIDDERVSIVTDRLKPGTFMGLIAFTTGNQSMTTAHVVRNSRAVRIRQDDFDEYLHRRHHLSYPMQQLMIANLVDRYQQNTALQVKMEWLNWQLLKERNELKRAYEDLENTQNLLIHKEKATLGQLVAGFAHEINNPVSSLVRSAESLADQLREIIDSSTAGSDMITTLFRAGLQSRPADTVNIRRRMSDLREHYPAVPRSALRKLAQLPEHLSDRLREMNSDREIESLLEYYETGKLLQNVQLAGRRIGNLVKSLKNYSRQDYGSSEQCERASAIPCRCSVTG